MAEYLRTKGFAKPQEFTIRKLFTFYHMHQEIENRMKSEELDMLVTATSVFKTKEGFKKFKKMLLKFMQ